MSDSATLWTVAPGSSVHGILQARILEWVARPPPVDLPHPGIEPASLTSPALACLFFTTSAMWEALVQLNNSKTVAPAVWTGVLVTCSHR